MRAAVIWTISDFSAYSMLSGWNTSGKYACPYCMEETDAFSLKHGRKTCWFDCHRKFLDNGHPFRKNRLDFKKGRVVKKDLPPNVKSGWEILKELENIGMKKITEPGADEYNQNVAKFTGWNTRSIFWDLPYWSDLRIRHNLDVMHIEKHVFDNVFNTVLNVPGKSKDNLKARYDIREICQCEELEPDVTGKRYAKAKYTLTAEQKKILFEWMRNVKFPDGYMSNLSKCIDAQKNSVCGMKSHDCHVFMQRLMPVAFRSFLDYKYWEPLAQLSVFFKDLTCSELRHDVIQALHKEIPVIICKLERMFPPAFFDSMEHLSMHLPFEASLGGPVQYRWMYPFERFLRRLKRTVGDKAIVDGSICSTYQIQETTTFCSYYFDQHIPDKFCLAKCNEVDSRLPKGVDSKDLSIFTFPGRTSGKGVRRLLSDEEYHIIQTYVLCNCLEISPYIDLFLDLFVRPSHPGITEAEESARIDKDFRTWFYFYVQSPTQPVTNEHIKMLARGPSMIAKSFPCYFVKGYRFHTKHHSSNRATDNSGICIKGTYFGTKKEDFFGVLDEILELQYLEPSNKQIVIFNCTWFETSSHGGTRIHPQLKIIEVNKSI